MNSVRYILTQDKESKYDGHLGVILCPNLRQTDCFPWSLVHHPWSSHIFEILDVRVLLKNCTSHFTPLPRAVCENDLTESQIYCSPGRGL